MSDLISKDLNRNIKKACRVRSYITMEDSLKQFHDKSNHVIVHSKIALENNWLTPKQFRRILSMKKNLLLKELKRMEKYGI